MVGAILMLAGCASAHLPTDERRSFPYEIPGAVTDADAATCDSRSRSPAFSARMATSDGSVTGATAFGLLGVLTLYGAIENKENKAYRQTMDDCLKEKGYALTD